MARWGISVLTTGCLFGACAPTGGDKAGQDTGGDTGSCDPTVASLEIPDFHTAPELLQVAVSPTDIDPASDQQPEDQHEIFALASGPTRDNLFVMLPGTDGRPANNQNLLTIAAESGYRAIGLAYPTETNQELCADDQDCLEGFNEEKAYGTDETTIIDVDEPNSVVGRLSRLLVALDTRYPDEGWDQYMDGTAPAWDHIALAGFSQGSGLAGWIGKDHALARFVAFSTGCDNIGTTPDDASPADWCFAARATPAQNTFGILHTEDHFSIKEQVYLDAFELDAFGDFADADAESPDYCTGTHILTTSLEPNDAAASEAYHKSLATDADMPVDEDGVPLLAEDQWYLMAGGT